MGNRIRISKKNYLFAFNSSLYDPLHVQPIISYHMKTFHSGLLHPKASEHCRDLWPTMKPVAEPSNFDRCEIPICNSIDSGGNIISCRGSWTICQDR